MSRMIWPDFASNDLGTNWFLSICIKRVEEVSDEIVEGESLVLVVWPVGVLLVELFLRDCAVMVHLRLLLCSISILHARVSRHDGRTLEFRK